MDVGLGGEGADAVASQDIDGGSGNEVIFGDERDGLWIGTFVGDAAIERVF